jgi:predicted short-subunit dehydrogenase-like oxidoreductase (DUF2520 family)
MLSTLHPQSETRHPAPESAVFGVVGPGRLGASLARELVAAGLQLGGVAGGAPGRAQRLVADLPGVPVLQCEALLTLADVVFLTVPDAALPALSASLPFRAGQFVVHCSGVLGLGVLEPARARGAAVGCLHPLQSFSVPQGETGRLRGVSCGVEAEQPHDAWLGALCLRFGARPLPLAGVDRAAYHAAAVFVSNYLVALYAAAERAFRCAGLPAEAAREALLPLSRGTLDNLALRAPAAALTGPLLRGDAPSVAAHVSALAADPALLALYRALAQALLELPLPLESAEREAIVRALEPV